MNGRAVCDSHHINEDVLYATYHAAVKAMIEDAGALLEVIQTETEVEMQPRNKAAAEGVFSLCLRFCRCFQRLKLAATVLGKKPEAGAKE